ncbi:O-antigen polymerase [Phocaeicola sartorii]|uniref:Uncharacterized protein n=1 Tax=Phocaeicola sartorii TaxID=671267 RepID=R9IFU7_9BACT|nr:O-antigen polymerase [Phocaeicola sartorii]EOS12234.1 hypothetical protein C802_02047 [Phocaeicola sartorii]MCR1846256.1 oligosaccharide repeat unit polymerase [Phocaeicola sartorii]NBH66589.1 oligosaccharide repeat unit polymerase [Phocaeicola sartorii]NUK98541.1 oligosaccharide repeat unit polymerase [Phocaeicola sartorii]
MNEDLFILMLNITLYVTTFLFLLRYKVWNIGTLVWTLFTISHIGSFFYYFILVELGFELGHIRIAPFLYLYSCILLCLYPFIKYGRIKKITTVGNDNFLILLSYFIIILSIEPFFENIVLLFSNTQTTDFADLYKSMRSEELSIYSNIGARLNQWSIYFRLPSTFLFFYYFSKERKILTIGLGVVLINYLLSGINSGTRGIIIIMGILYICCFFMMVNLFSKKQIKYIRKVGAIFSILFLVFFSIITLSRYNVSNQDKTMVGSLLLYSSEGPIKFNNEMYYGEHNTKGDVNLCFFKSLIGLKTYTTFKERDEYYLNKNGRRVEVFYTYIGDFVSDFGLIGGLFICLLLFISCLKILRSKKIFIGNFLFLLFVVHLYAIGFASNVYRGFYFQKGIGIMLILILIMYFNRYMHECRKKKQQRVIISKL